MTNSPIKKRKICVPYDNVCLQGGCGYCNDFGKWRAVSTLERETRGTALESDFQYGLQYDFHNADVRR